MGTHTRRSEYGVTFRVALAWVTRVGAHAPCPVPVDAGKRTSQDYDTAAMGDMSELERHRRRRRPPTFPRNQMWFMCLLSATDVDRGGATSRVARGSTGLTNWYYVRTWTEC